MKLIQIAKNQIKFILDVFNQSCCLQIYFDIKNKFDFLLILGMHLITFFIIILIFGFYIHYKLKTNFEDEEILEKKNFLFIGILTICIYIFVFPFIFSLPTSSNQSLLNKIENNEVSESLSIIQNDLIVRAVTHVVVDSPTKGYGIFIKNMLEEAFD